MFGNYTLAADTDKSIISNSNSNNKSDSIKNKNDNKNSKSKKNKRRKMIKRKKINAWSRIFNRISNTSLISSISSTKSIFLLFFYTLLLIL